VTKDDLAKLIYALENHFDFPSLDKALENWDGIKEWLDKPPWDNGQHCGDCTKVPTRCFRCLVEDVEKLAQRLFDDYKEDDIMNSFNVLGAILDILGGSRRSQYKRAKKFVSDYEKEAFG
jgi:hypothetical protein